MCNALARYDIVAKDFELFYAHFPREPDLDLACNSSQFACKLLIKILNNLPNHLPKFASAT